MKDVRISGGIQLISNEVKVKVKKLVPEAVVPFYSRPGDAGMDMTAISVAETDMYIEYGTGIALQLPPNYVGLIYPRSSLSNYDLILANHVGVIDSNYVGEIKFRFKRTMTLPQVGRFYPTPETLKVYKIGDRIGQIIVQKIPEVKFEEVEELDKTVRGENGYGSSGV